MYKLLAGLLAAGSVFAQEPSAEETALRARVEQFYDLHKQKKFRQADALVHEDAKDAFFAKEKNAPLGYKIQSVTFGPDGKAAKVITMLDTNQIIQGMGVVRMPLPSLTYWVKDSANWFWAVPPPEIKNSPFGKWSDPSLAGKTDEQIRETQLKDLQKEAEETRKRIMGESGPVIIPDKPAVALSWLKPSTVVVLLENKAPGSFEVLVDGKSRPGLTATLEGRNMQPGQKMKMTIQWLPPKGAKKADRPAAPIFFNVRSPMINASTAVTVNFID
jgi:hypothetical protein